VKPFKHAACHSKSEAGAIRIITLVWLGFAAWFVTLFILSSIPGDRFGPLPFSWADKVVHTIIFTTGSFLLATAAYRTFGKSFAKTMILIFVIMVLIGAGDEYHQIYTPGRSGNDLGDLSADALGSLIGIFFAGFLHGKRSPKSNLPAPGADRPA
jgi:hypothetical protein